MRYTLVIGIQHKKYKKPAKVTISVGDRMIDAFTIDQTHKQPDDFMSLFTIDEALETHWYNNTHDPFGDGETAVSRLPDRLPWSRPWSRTPIPNFLKVYDIGDPYLNGTISIKVENSDNNYTNGFMTKTSLLRLPVIALFPTEFTKNRARTLMQAVIGIEMSYGNMVRRTGVGWKSDDTRVGWPCANNFRLQADDKHNKSRICKFDEWIGGDFTAEMQVHKKFGIKYLTAKGNRKIGFPYSCSPKDLFVASFKQLLNIYDENQRSNSTKD